MSHKKGLSLFSITILVGLFVGSVFLGVVPAYAADGSGTNTVSPTSTDVSSTGNTFMFTSTAAEMMNSGGISISVPAGWSAPQENIGTAGYITATSPAGIVGDVITNADTITDWQEDDTDACNTANIAVNSGTKKEGTNSILCSNSGSTAPDDGDSFSYRFGNADWSSYTKIGVWVRSTVAISSATNYIQVAYIDGVASTDLGDGAAAEVFNIQSLAANTWTYFTFDLTAARTSVNGIGIICKGGGCDSKNIFVDYILIGPGSPTISGAGPWTVNVPYVTMPSAGTATVTYGSGGGTSGVTAPSSSGVYTFTTQSRFDAGGALTNIASSPTITVNKLSTTIAVSSSASTSVYGNTVTFTATTTPESGGPATGTVTFKNGATTMGTGTLSGNVATYATSSLNVTGSPYSITAVYGGDGSFSGSTSSAIVQTITPKVLTVTGMTASNKTYDATTTVTLSGGALVGVVGSDVVSINTRTGSFADKNVGTGKTVTVTSVTLTGADAGNYTATNPTGITANIAAAALTVTGMTASNKTYDATTTATLSGGSLVGVIAGDTASINTRTGTFNNKNVGTSKPITVSSVTLAGTDAGNYTVTNPTDVVATITAKALAVTGLSAQDKIYNATTTATLIGGSLVGAIIGDTVSISTRVGAFTSKHVGANKPVTVTAITLTGTDFENYSVTLPTGITASITTKGITVSGITANDKDYDGNTSATLVVIGATLNGVIGGDDATLNTASGIGTFDTPEVGIDKLVTITGLTIGGVDGGNYLLAQPTTTATIKNIVPVVAIVSPNEAFTNDADTVITVSGAGFTAGTIIKFDGDNLTTTFINGITATATVSSSYFTTTGTSTITAFNPAPGGGLSTTSVVFLRKNRVPTITSLVPNTAEEGSATTSLTINGTNFVGSTAVTFDGTPLVLSATSTTVLETNIPVALLSTFGTSTVAVTNPAPGGGTATASFIITRGAVKFAFSGAPYNGTVDAPITVTIQAQRENGTVATNYQNDVTLHTGGSASPSSVLVNIVNGIGTTSISNTVAETVTLSLSDTQTTGLDVTATTLATFAHGAIAQFALAGPATLNAGDRAAFTVTRKDQFSNPVTTGPNTTVYFYTTSTSSSAVFYNASTAGSLVTSAVMASGTSTAIVWYYDEEPGLYTITASDNGTAPDGAVGIDDATSTITVNAVATRFVIIDPTDGTVDAAITITVQAQDNLGRLITDYQSDVTLIASSTSGQATTPNNGLVNIVNGEGTINVSNTVAETVNLSLSDSQATGLNVASSTQDVVFAPGVVAQFSLTHSGDMEQNTRKEFVAGRKDQYGNVVSASTTPAYLYASPTSTTKFYDAVSGGNEITSISLTPGNATTSFWFYSNTPATTTVTVSDNATAPDADTGINDASNELLVTPIAVRFEIVDPTDGTVDAPITVTVRALDEFGQVVPSFTEDVTLLVSGSAAANPVLVDLESGVGTTQVSNTVAEIVTLSLSDTQSTGLVATSTQDVVFGVGTFAKLNLNNVVNATAGDLVAYTVTRTDQYNNAITSGSMTVTLSATPTTTPGVFYSANSTSSSEIASVAIDPGNASAQFWYYNEAAESYQVTAQSGAVVGYDDIVIDPATIAKFTMNDRTSMNPGSRVQYTVVRKDAFNNLVTAGAMTAYLYADPAGVGTAFYDAATNGNTITSITIASGQSSRDMWYYEETDGAHTITASDNATAPDGAAGILDATDSILVQTATGTRFVFNPDPSPLTVTAGNSSLVTIQVQDDFGNVDTNYQTDITLVTGVTSVTGSGLINGEALIDIINGEGTITLTNTVAETVNLALSDSQSTGLTVTDAVSIVWTPGAVAQFTITDQTSMVAGTSTTYGVARKDQYGNHVTSGSNLIYLYTNSTGASARFQATETGTSSISFVTIANGFASTTFYYYDETAGTWDITASDNATTPDGATGIADASDSLIVTPAPVVADRYVILNPADAGLNEVTVVIIQTQDADGALDTTIQEDVYLVFSTSSVSATGKVNDRVLVDIVDGVGTVQISDTVAETVQLSLARVTGSTSTLAIPSTQDVMFFVRQGPAAGFAGGGVYVAPAATVSFTGRAYPGARISLFARIGGQDITLERDIEVRADGTFTIDFSGALRGLESFGLAIFDKDGKIAQIKTYTMDKVTRATEEKNLYIAPTAGLVQRTVTTGNNVGIIGSAAPGSMIKAEVDGQPVAAQAQVGNNGTYRLLVNTREFDYGGHIVRVKQVDRNGIESDWSPSKAFIVSRALVTRADLNNNGGIDIGDWSIFLTRFASVNAEERMRVDLNDDGKVDLSDFSIFIRSVVNQ